MQGYAYQQPNQDPNVIYGTPGYAYAGYDHPAGAQWPAGIPAHDVASHSLRAAGHPEPADSRLRWGRLLLLIIGVALVALAVVNVRSPHEQAGGNAGAASGKARDIAGDDASAFPVGGSPVADSSSDTDTSDGAPTDAIAPVGSDATLDATTAEPPVVSGGGGAAPAARHADARRLHAASRQHARHARTGFTRRGRAAVGGGGAPGASSLPYTGASTWIAAMIGAMLLGIGMIVQLRAMQIGEAASLYRRGPLLRPAFLVALMVRNAARALDDVVGSGQAPTFVTAQRR